MRRRLFPGIPLLLLSFFVAFQGRVPITAGYRLQQSFQAEIGTKSSSGDRDGADTESLLAVPAEKATMFLTARTFPAGGRYPNSVAIGDFNGDGKPDLVTPNSLEYHVSVLLAKGNFDFRPAVNYATGSNPYSVAVGDFNGDGKLDLAVANIVDNTVSVLLGNGDGTFQPAVNYAAGSFVTVAVGDFNGDGKPDLVTAGGGNVSVLLGNGDGTFQPAVNSAAPNAGSVAIGDFNRDGKLDLVTTNLESNNVSVLIGNGDGTFRTAVNYAVGVFPYSVAVGDFNGDGKLDLAVANSTCKSVCLFAGSVSILLGNGDGTFQAAVNYKVAPTPSYVAVRDFNNDGKLDLVTANGIGNMTVLLGNGDGTFQVGVNYTVGGQIPVSGAVGDFNGDGAPDLAFLNGGVVVLLNTRGTVASLTSSVNPSSVGEEVTFTADVHRTVRGSQILAGKMTGTVTFRNGTKTLGTVPWLSHINTFTTSSLSKGTHTITATYSGDSNFNPVTSPPLTQTVQ